MNPPRVRKPRRILIYGTSGIGKSTFGAMAPSAKFIATEDGLDDVNCDAFPLSTSFADVMQNLGAIYSDPQQFQTVVVDSLDWLERLIWKDVCQSRNVSTIEDIGYGKGYSFALVQWNEFIQGLDALRNDRGLTIILIAHAKIERFENPETDSYDRYSPRLHKLASNLFQEWCSEVLFATYKVYTTKTKEGFDKERTRGVANERILRTTEKPSHVAKNRLNLPDEIPLDWNEFSKHLAA